MVSPSDASFWYRIMYGTRFVMSWVLFSQYLLLDLGQDLAVPEEVVLVLSDLDGRAAVLGNEDAITLGNTHGDTLAILVESAGANGENLGLVELLDAGLGKEETWGGLGLSLDALDEDAVQKGDEGLDRTEGGGLNAIELSVTAM
jgi:hypothetical protein